MCVFSQSRVEGFLVNIHCVFGLKRSYSASVGHVFFTFFSFSLHLSYFLLSESSHHLRKALGATPKSLQWEEGLNLIFQFSKLNSINIILFGLREKNCCTLIS